MADKFMHILNDDTQNYHFCRLQLEFETFGHSINKRTNKKSLKKVVKSTNKKRYFKTLGTSEINSQCPLPP